MHPTDATTPEKTVHRTRRLAGLAVLCSLVIAACGGGGSDAGTAPAPTPAPAPAPTPPPAAPSYVVRNLFPSAADPAAVTAEDTASDYHVVIPPLAGVAPVNKLFVFLPGTGGVPNQYQLILKAGARRGFHAIGLDYPNPAAVGVLCAASRDPDCFWNVRREVITGDTSLSADITVTPPNAIVTRLAKALAYLNQTYPGEGWGQYLATGGAPEWSKVVMAGHSQGGGHAGVMTKLFALGRACYFASPPDWNTATHPTAPNAPATWTSYPNLTPTARQFGFGGLQDPSVPYDRLSPIWQALGLGAYGAAVSVDSGTAPFAGSHMLTTNAQPAASSAPGTPLHGLTVRDVFTPLDAAGQPLFDAAWGYLCFQ